MDLLEQLLTANTQPSTTQLSEKKLSAGITNDGKEILLNPEMPGKLEQLAKEWQADVAGLKDAFGQLAAKPDEKKEKMLDSAAVMKMLNISKSSLHRYRKNKIIPCKKLGRKFLYRETDIIKLLQNVNRKSN